MLLYLTPWVSWTICLVTPTSHHNIITDTHKSYSGHTTLSTTTLRSTLTFVLSYQTLSSTTLNNTSTYCSMPCQVFLASPCHCLFTINPCLVVYSLHLSLKNLLPIMTLSQIEFLPVSHSDLVWYSVKALSVTSLNLEVRKYPAHFLLGSWSPTTSSPSTKLHFAMSMIMWMPFCPKC